MREPRNRIAFAAAGGVLNQIPPPNAGRRRIRQEFPRHIQLMIARKDGLVLFAPARVFRVFDDLSVVLKNVRQARFRQNVLPQIRGF